MKQIIEKEEKVLELTYAETLNKLIHEGYFEELMRKTHVLFVSSEDYYELWYDKLIQLVPTIDAFHWYILPNAVKHNTLDAYKELIDYIDEMALPKETLLFSMGDASCYHLCGYVAATSSYITGLYYLPSDIVGLIDSLSGEAMLDDRKRLNQCRLSLLREKVVYDLHLTPETDVYVHTVQEFNLLLRVGFLTNQGLLETLFNHFMDNQLIAYLPEIIESSLKLPTDYRSFGQLFSKGLYEMHEGHYLDSTQKECIGLLLHLTWAFDRGGLTFDRETFYDWVAQIVSINLRLPRRMVTYDLSEAILKECQRSPRILGLTQIGEACDTSLPTLEELYHAIESYRTYYEERGTFNHVIQ